MLERMVGAIKTGPSARLRGNKYALAAWQLASNGKIDRQRRAAWLGHPRQLPESLSVQNAPYLGGEYAMIVGEQDGLLLASGANQSLLLVRLADGAIVACSRLEPLLACVSTATPNVRALGALILGRPPDAVEATVFSEISCIEARSATFLGLSPVQERVAAELAATPIAGTPDELAEELRAIVQKVVKRAIEGVNRIGVLVSGGLDSSTILAHAVAAAKGANRAEIIAVTWAFSGLGDDRPYLKELCDSLGIIPFHVSTADASRNVMRALTLDGSPFIWPTAAGILTAHECARDNGAELVLTGLGGDDIFNGHPRILARQTFSNDLGKALRIVARRPAQRVGYAALARTVMQVVSPTLMSRFPSIQRTRRRQIARRRWPWAGPQLLEIIGDTYLFEPPNRDWATSSNAPRLKRLLKNTFRLLATHRRQREATTGLREVDPFLDDDLINFVSGISQEALFFGDRRRGLLRHAMRHLVPERVRLRSSKARFEGAVAEMVCTFALPQLRELASMSMLARLGLVDAHGYLANFEHVVSAGAKSQDWLSIWPALAAEAFLRSRWDSYLNWSPSRA